MYTFKTARMSAEHLDEINLAKNTEIIFMQIENSKYCLTIPNDGDGLKFLNNSTYVIRDDHNQLNYDEISRIVFVKNSITHPGEFEILYQQIKGINY